MKKNIVHSYSLITIVAIISFLAGGYAEFLYDTSKRGVEYIEAERMGTGSLINPLLECEMKTYGSNQKYIPFEKELKERITQDVIEKNPDVHVSLYFRNIRNGPWFGIDEEADFSPASLMKLPITMAYAKWGETYPEIWSKTFSGETETRSVQNIGPEAQVEAGKSYTINELIRYSLVYSDNNANITLLKNIPVDTLFKIFRELNIPVIDKIENGVEEYISVKEYASFFRILYNASYLSHERSSYLLNIMTESTITGGLRNPIPSNIQIAHKFGERRIQNPDNSNYISQFHDCGIIYYENYPYILCVMTKGGDNMPRLEGIVSDISSIVFEEIRKRY